MARSGKTKTTRWPKQPHNEQLPSLLAALYRRYRSLFKNTLSPSRGFSLESELVVLLFIDLLGPPKIKRVMVSSCNSYLRRNIDQITLHWSMITVMIVIGKKVFTSKSMQEIEWCVFQSCHSEKYMPLNRWKFLILIASFRYFFRWRDQNCRIGKWNVRINLRSIWDGRQKDEKARLLENCTRSFQAKLLVIDSCQSQSRRWPTT